MSFFFGRDIIQPVTAASWKLPFERDQTVVFHGGGDQVKEFLMKPNVCIEFKWVYVSHAVKNL